MALLPTVWTGLAAPALAVSPYGHSCANASFGLRVTAVVRQRCQKDLEWWVRAASAGINWLRCIRLTPANALGCLQADRIQVTINLNGYTKGARNEIFALCPAPVQTSYMGFPATTGASFLPYLITDKVCSQPKPN